MWLHEWLFIRELIQRVPVVFFSKVQSPALHWVSIMTVLSFVLSLSSSSSYSTFLFHPTHTSACIYTHHHSPPSVVLLVSDLSSFSPHGHGGLFANTHAKQNDVTILLLLQCYRGMPFVTILTNTQLTDFQRDFFFSFLLDFSLEWICATALFAIASSFVVCATFCPRTTSDICFDPSTSCRL